MASVKERNTSKNSYTAKDIVVLEGLEAVRKRPGMYIGGVHKTGLHHLIWEIVDNSVDEVMNGHASRIKVRLHSDGETITIQDNGRGIPVDIHPKYKKSALEVLLTTLHSGGKFEEGNYKHSGGLHGVGISVVNALSSDMSVEVKRHGNKYKQSFSQGMPQTELLTLEEGVRGTGTTVTYRADPEIFKRVKLDANLVRERLEIKAFLHRKLRIEFTDEVTRSRHEFYHEGGIEDYLKHLVKTKGSGIVHKGLFNIQVDSDIRLEAAL